MTSYWTNDGCLAFAFSPSDEGEETYYTVLQNPRISREVHRLRDGELPKRYTLHEAEDDLARYAKKNGWRVAYSG